MQVKLNSKGFKFMPSAYRTGRACSWIGTAITDDGIEGALAFNDLSQNYVQFTSPNESIQLDNAQVIAAITEHQNYLLTGKKPKGRPLLHGERVHPHQIMLTLTQASDIKDIGDGNLSEGVRRLLANFTNPLQ